MTRSRDIFERGERVDLLAVSGPSGADFFDLRTPRSLLLARENPDEQPDRSDIFTLLMGYLFTDGPHPATVMRRLYGLAEECAPALVAGMATAERRRLTEESEEASAWRVLALLNGTRAAGRSAGTHETVIRRTLAEAHARLRAVQLLGGVDGEALLRLREAETLGEFARRQEATLAVLRFIFFEGPEPRRTVRRLYVLAKALCAPLILNMTLEHLGALFGETRAAWSWRAKRKFNDYLASRGVNGCKAPYQKSDEACAAYARAQLGNTNRRGGCRVA